MLDSAGTGSGIGETEGKLVFDLEAIETAYGPSFLSDYELAVSFKGSKAFSIFYWEAPVWEDAAHLIDPPTIMWEVSITSKEPALSHASVWFRKTISSSPSVVSEGSSLFALLGIGLFGLAMVNRKKRS